MRNLVSQIDRKVSELKSTAPNRIPDPLLENVPELSNNIRQRLAIWHGQVIENSLAEWIRAIPDWDCDVRTTIKVGNSVQQLDDIAFNKRTGKCVIWECKRIWENVQIDPGRLKVSTDLQNVENNLSDIKNHVKKKTGTSVSCCSLVVFNTWGTSKEWNTNDARVKEYPILCRSEIGQMIAPCLWRFIEEHRAFIAYKIGTELLNKQQEAQANNPFFNPEFQELDQCLLRLRTGSEEEVSQKSKISKTKSLTYKKG